MNAAWAGITCKRLLNTLVSRRTVSNSKCYLRLTQSVNLPQIRNSAASIQQQTRFAQSLVQITSNQKKSSKKASGSIFGVLAGGTIVWLGANYLLSPIVYCEDNKNPDSVKCGHFINDLPVYTEEQVLNQSKAANRIWVIYKEGVYDITEFAEGHPGGERILMATGTSIEPFWQMYPVHYSDENFERLESFRIGNFKASPSEKSPSSSNDPFANDPKRNPLLKVLLQKPFNAESPKAISADSLITPNEFHFVRNHLPVPVVDKAKHRLEIVDQTSGKTFSFTMRDLETKFPIHTICATMQCSGNKRKFMNDYEAVQGLMWDVNSISTAEWMGVKLSDVLNYCKLNLVSEKVQHVQFEGLDKDPSGQCYGASVPKERIAKDGNDVLLAFKMNGVDIPPDHGFPLRVVIPGVTGARSVKWLTRIVLGSEESKSHWQQNDYKVLPPSVKNLKECDLSQYSPIQETPVQSGICQPLDGAVIDKEDGTFVLKGYAFSGGGNSIEKVLLSLDGGRTWTSATLKQLKAPPYRNWAWTLWECEMEIPQDKQSVEIVCAATDSQQNVQPESVKAIWNVRGLMNNAWHRIKVQLK